MRRAPLVLALLLGCSNPGDAPGKSDTKQAANPEVTAADASKTDEAKPDATKPDATKTDTTKPDVAKTDATKTEPTPTEPTLPPLELVIANDEGLHRYDLAGKRLATLVKGSATQPRVLPDGRIVFLRDEGGKLTLWLHATGSPAKLVAELPRLWDPKACKVTTKPASAKPEPEPKPDRLEGGEGEEGDEGEGEEGGALDFELAVQAAGDFRVDAVKQEACIRLQDRNDNMVNFGVALWVSLADGGLRQAVYEDIEESCKVAEGAGEACFDFALGSTPPEPPATPPSFPFAFDDQKSTLQGPEGKSQRLCGEGEEAQCASIDSRSPSGRFVVLNGNLDEGDYIYRELVLLDLQDGTLWAFEEQAMIATLPAQIFEAHQDWYAAVGESDIRWLPHERLWLDGLLVDPVARKAVSIGGSLAHP